MAAPSVTSGGNSSLLLARWLTPAAPNGPLTSYELWLRQSSSETGADNAGTRIFVAVGYFDPLASATRASAGANVPALATFALLRGLVAYTAYDLRVVAVGLLGSTSSNLTTATTEQDGTSSGKHLYSVIQRTIFFWM